MNLNPDYRSALYDCYFDSHVRYFENVSPELLECLGVTYRKLLGKFLPPNPQAQILDVGCGYGGLVHFLQKAGYGSAGGIDISPQQVEQARKLGIPGVSLADSSSFLRERVSQFDLITALDVIEHLKKEEVLGFVSAVFRALKPAGRFLVRVSNGASPFGGRYRYGDLTHELAYTTTSLRQVLAYSGFKKIECFPVEPTVHGIVSATRYVLWKGIDLFFHFCSLVETGEFRNQIFTQNLIAVAEKG